MVSNCDSGICQNPLLASNLLKILAPAIWAKVSSTLGIGWISLHTSSLRGFRSTQIRIAPDFLGATTMPAHQGVGSDTFRITPSFSMRFSSCWTFCRKGMGMFLGAYKAYGVASPFSLISYPSPKVPSP